MNTKEQIDAVLNHTNWTGMSLHELIAAGRIIPTDKKTIWKFVTAALGEPEDMTQWEEMRRVNALVMDALA
jgi:hypothetical protein